MSSCASQNSTSSENSKDDNSGAIVLFTFLGVFLWLGVFIGISLWLRPVKMSIRQWKWINGLFVVAIFVMTGAFSFLNFAPENGHAKTSTLVVLIVIIHLFFFAFVQRVLFRREYYLRLVSYRNSMSAPIKALFISTLVLFQILTAMYYIPQISEECNPFISSKIRMTLVIIYNFIVWSEMAHLWMVCTAEKFVIVRTRTKVELEVVNAKKMKELEKEEKA